MSRLQNSYLKSSGNFEVTLVKNIQDKESELLSMIKFDEDSTTGPSIEDRLSPKSETYLESESITSRPDLIPIKSSMKDLEPKKSLSPSQDLELLKSRTDEKSSKPVRSIIDLETSTVKSSTNLDPDWAFELASFKLECPSPWIYIVSKDHVKTIASRRSLAKDGIKIDIFFRNVQRK